MLIGGLVVLVVLFLFLVDAMHWRVVADRLNENEVFKTNAI